MTFEKKVKSSIGIIIFIWFLFISLGISGIVYSCSKIQQHGLKNIVYNIWEGEKKAPQE